MLALVGAALAVVPASGFQGAKSRTQPPMPVRRVVVIDAGHGGPKTGMLGRLPSGSQFIEKDVTLGISLKLRDELKKRGVDVVMTRTRDVDVELEERGRIANDAHGDLFISIHVNAPGTSESRAEAAAMRGFETYFLAEAKTEDERRVEAMENGVVRFETSATAQKNDPLSFIINDMAQTEHLRESSDLAGTIQQYLAQTHPGPSRGVKQANFSVLRNAFMPAVLVETGYGSNAKEAYWLSSESGQRELASSIADATMAYLKNYERRVSAGGQR